MKKNKKNKKVRKVKKIKNKKIKLKTKAIFIFLVCLILIGLIILYIISIPISNIFISGNSYLKDQQIIELAKIENYPSSLKNYSSKIKKQLEKNIYIKKAKVNKKLFTMVYIQIEENRPLFINHSTNKTILLDKSETEDKFSVPTLINYIPDVIYDEFVNKMGIINIDILDKISEIKYDPDEVDDSRFLLTMNDSNYVYVSLNKLDKINNYNDIVKQFDNKKGVLYLNSGGYFEIAK